MRRNHDSLARQWHMVRMVPRYPQKITVQAICGRLASAGFEITQRSVQRDLNELSNFLPLQCDEREKPYGWSWQKDAPSFDLPGLTVPEAITLAMAEYFLQNLLPQPMLRQLQPQFQAAHKILATQGAGNHRRTWLSKVVSVSATQPLLAPKIDAEVQSVISGALLNERQALIRYRRRSEAKAITARIHPLALIQRGPMLYLCCRFFDYDDLRTLALNRISSVTLLEESTVYPKGFSLQEMADKGVWGFGAGEKEKLEAVFSPGYGDHLYETPLSRDQVITVLHDGALRIEATVADAPQLLWWLLGFGEGVEVIRPAKLRQAIVLAVNNMAAQYK
jgi:predicted DNA-binding transcriptional regulator YafY